ncbi:Aquaporin NIP2-1 [Cyphellophora attinorum]|uniref:Aquaporin NIP2-1 n=1 Tax=Cyphellophora attinorum TaxID=1664694 RepID=A0A0N0NJS6_9EURO|nr:Aquaporin NIP2-1 [Phialophora attinorum]KPI37321.1 Aquaporin NIP2-1 [Phialophora attinorum]
MASPNASFAGRLGGIQQFTVNREDPDEQPLLEKTPDAAPNVAIRDLFRMSLFKDPFLWKAACIEAMGTFLLVFVTGYFAISPNLPNPDPSPTSGNFAHAGFIAPLVGLLINGVFITMLIYACGATSGAHFNPLITIATFFARLTTFPRAVLYVAGQMGGGALAGLMLRAAVNTREFKVGGCFLFPNDRINASTALTVEFGAATLLLFCAFGVGLDPRQGELFGPALGPPLVGIASATVIFAFSYSESAYGGASLNPARCFGVFVGSRFPGWSWVTWVGPLLASIFHGIIYCLIPPGPPQKSKKLKRTHRDEEGSGHHLAARFSHPLEKKPSDTEH